MIGLTPDQLVNSAQLGNLKMDIFIRPEFMRLIAQSIPVRSYCLNKTGQENYAGIIHFAQLQDFVFSSPGRGSYGGMQIDQTASVAEILEFAKAIEDDLRSVGARKISITLPPSHYRAAEIARETEVWQTLGFGVERTEINYAIPITDRDFSSVVEHSVRKRVKKCQRQNYTATELGLEQLDQAYAVIAANREARGYPMTMTLPALRATAQAVSPAVKVFGVLNQSELIAAAVVYEINPSIDYVFYWGDKPGFEKFSPVTLLADHLYARARRTHKRWLDLGISTVQGVPNEGLVKFKETLGATAAPKLVMSKSFAG